MISFLININFTRNLTTRTDRIWEEVVNHEPSTYKLTKKTIRYDFNSLREVEINEHITRSMDLYAKDTVILKIHIYNACM